MVVLATFVLNASRAEVALSLRGDHIANVERKSTGDGSV